MSNAHDRRAPGVARIPFDAMVEVGGALGPSFEAQAINLSEEGMSMRTAYLPDIGQPVMCRFDAGHEGTIVVAGEVTWRDDLGDGGEFGIRFTNLDAPSGALLQRILGADRDGQPGNRVRLHIEGLASPMRARIKEQSSNGVTAYSELGFLQMGRPLELEDAASGNRRPALIDRVEVAVDDASRIPQLVVSLRYEDAPAEDVPPLADEEEPHVEAARDDAPEAVTNDDAPAPFKQKVVARMQVVGPAIADWAKRAKTAAALLAARARRKPGSDVEIPVRRTTAPAPGGGLHAEGRKVVRTPEGDDASEETESPRFAITKKTVALGAAVLLAGLLVFLAFRKPDAQPIDQAAIAESAAPIAAETPPVATPVPPPVDPLAAAAASKPAGKPAPFTNGPVGAHPTVMKIKMDGAIDSVQGAAQPTGFTIVIPKRKSIEPTASLADKDPRIAAIQVSNEPTGAELSVSFKDGVPNYLVRAHGDTLEMVLARSSAHGDKTEAHAKKKHSGRAQKKH
jgi:hypothetical protein